jgi:hypothetical protein
MPSWSTSKQPNFSIITGSVTSTFGIEKSAFKSKTPEEYDSKILHKMVIYQNCTAVDAAVAISKYRRTGRFYV